MQCMNPNLSFGWSLNTGQRSSSPVEEKSGSGHTGNRPSLLSHELRGSACSARSARERCDQLAAVACEGLGDDNRGDEEG